MHTPSRRIPSRPTTASSRRRFLQTAATGLATPSLLAACAGYRGGWESVAYVGGAPSTAIVERRPLPAGPRPDLGLPGLRLAVDLNNRLQDHDTQFMLVAVPVKLDFIDRQRPPADPGSTWVTLKVTPLDEGFVFEPKRARLALDQAWTMAREGHEFGRREAPGQPAPQGGDDRWHAIGDGVALADGHTYHLGLVFPVPTPSPRRPDIQLDLSQALRSPRQAALPLIRFLPTPWREGYA
ncbi:MAG: hypothetical protein KBC73_17770 [Burkholderiaceae bacterium]|nr:hypothetical protein [Burkholderiaceae bacterium]